MDKVTWGRVFLPRTWVCVSLILMLSTYHVHVAVTKTNGRILATFEKARKIKGPCVKERVCAFLSSVKDEQHDLSTECDGLRNISIQGVTGVMCHTSGGCYLC
jgi:hypothetical protein